MTMLKLLPPASLLSTRLCSPVPAKDSTGAVLLSANTTQSRAIVDLLLHCEPPRFLPTRERRASIDPALFAWRTRLRDRIVFGAFGFRLGPQAGRTTMRPHVDFIDTARIPEVSLRPGSYTRILSRDPETTARTALVRVVPGEGHVDQPKPHCHETSEEIFVVSGMMA